MSDIAPSSASMLMISESRHQRRQMSAFNSNGVSIQFTLSKFNAAAYKSADVAYSSLASQLSTAVSSGRFTTYLQQGATYNGATGLTAVSVVPTSLTTSLLSPTAAPTPLQMRPSTSPSYSPSSAPVQAAGSLEKLSHQLGGGAIAGIVIAFVSVCLACCLAATYYCCVYTECGREFAINFLSAPTGSDHNADLDASVHDESVAMFEGRSTSRSALPQPQPQPQPRAEDDEDDIDALDTHGVQLEGLYPEQPTFEGSGASLVQPGAQPVIQPVVNPGMQQIVKAKTIARITAKLGNSFDDDDGDNEGESDEAVDFGLGPVVQATVERDRQPEESEVQQQQQQEEEEDEFPQSAREHARGSGEPQKEVLSIPTSSVRSSLPVPALKSVAPSAPTTGALFVGMRVDANFYGEGEWYSGTVARVNADGTYSVHYDDGDFEESVTQENIVATALPITVDDVGNDDGNDDGNDVGNDVGSGGEIGQGSRVEANFQGEGEWYPGVVVKVRKDGTFNVLYDDGDSENKVTGENIRLYQ